MGFDAGLTVSAVSNKMQSTLLLYFPMRDFYYLFDFLEGGGFHK